MKQIVLMPHGTSRPCPLGGEMTYGEDGAVYLRRTAREAPTRTIPCVGCGRLRAEEFHFGIRKATCGAGHFRNSKNQFRWYSTHELLNPTRDLLVLVRTCPHFIPSEGD